MDKQEHYSLVARAKAAEIRQEARKKSSEILAEAQGKSSKILSDAEAQAQLLELSAKVFESGSSMGDITPLRTSPQHANVRSVKKTHRLNLSAAHSSTKFSVACRAAGYSIRDVAKLDSVGSNETTLRAGHRGSRSIPESLCLKVQYALGKDEAGQWRFPATKENWPRMRLGK